MTMSERMYYNIICEEMGITGGKIIHVDETKGTLQEVHEIVDLYSKKHPHAKWEMHPMSILVPVEE